MKKKKRIITFIDLSKKTVRKEDLPKDWQEEYWGGRGLNDRLLYELTDEMTDPEGPDNPLIFSTGPLTGTMVPTNGRYAVSSLSPLTGILGDGNAAGFFASELKSAGVDSLVVTGKAKEPVYLWIYDGSVKICSANHLWGKDTWDATAALKKERGTEIEAAVIGPAGENKVPFATIMNNSKRAVGRTGMGAVMGSKNLKALAVKGTRPIEIADPAAHRKIIEEMIAYIRRSFGYPLRSKYGTTVITDVYMRMGTLPINNAQSAYDERTENLKAEKFLPYTTSIKSCFACPIHCSRYTKVHDPSTREEVRGEGPEFETIAALGVRCGNFDLPSLLRMNHASNRLGVDTISMGGVISFLMECYQKSLITSKHLDGFELNWGNSKAMESLIEKVAFRQGCGSWLSKGVKELSKEIPGSEDFAIHVKGLEPAEQEPRGMKAWGLGWAVSSRGGDHLRAFPLAETTWSKKEALRQFGHEEAADPLSYKGKGKLVKWSEEISALCDSLILCKFSVMAMAIPIETVSKAMGTVLGETVTAKDLQRTGERIVNLERMFNARFGIDKKQDRLPERFKQPLHEGAAKGEVFELSDMLNDYYQARGWDKDTGLPTESTLDSLGLAFTNKEARR